MVNLDEVSDRDSRKYLQTRTSNGQWDQILALSQDIINKQFDTMFAQHPEMANMYTSIDDIGSLDAELLAPRILIPNEMAAGGGLNHVYFDIRLVRYSSILPVNCFLPRLYSDINRNVYSPASVDSPVVSWQIARATILSTISKAGILP